MITCIFENNNKTSLRHITVNAVVMKDNCVLLGKRGTLKGKKISEYGKWGLLGGFMGRDETLIEAVKREVMEESGWEITDIKLLKINDNPNRPKEDRQNVDFIYVAKAVVQVQKGDEEVSSLQWFPLDKLPPKEEIAFDHGDALDLVKEQQKITFEKVDVREKAQLLFEMDIKSFTRDFDYPARNINDTIHFFKECSVYLVYEDVTPIGLFAYKTEKNMVEVRQINLLPQFQGKGYGKKMMKKLLDLAKGHDIWLVAHPRNISAIVLYLKSGFEISGWKDNYYGNGQPRLILNRT